MTAIVAKTIPTAAPASAKAREGTTAVAGKFCFFNRKDTVIAACAIQPCIEQALSTLLLYLQT